MSAWSSFSRAAVLLLPLLPLPLAACNGSTNASGGVSPYTLDDQEAGAIAQVNAIRATVTPPIPQLTPCASLNQSASTHSDDMRDNNYLAETSPSGSTVRTRACMAGYTPSCTGMIPMAELVAEGFGTGAETVTQWQMDTKAGPILTQADILVVGCGRSIGADNERWTMDFASTMDPSCNGP